MKKVNSKDGTTIAYDQAGEGPALILVTGAIAKRSDAASVAASLAPYFTVFTYDRRGRGDSGDTQPYAVEREVEDLVALIEEAGGSAYLFGHSSGAILALDTAQQHASSIPKLALYEPPFIVDSSRPPLPDDFVNHLKELVSQGRRSEAGTYWMTTIIGVPADTVAQMQRTPRWPAIEAAAQTMIYDGTISADYSKGKPLPPMEWASVTMPTLVMDGGDSPPMMHSATLALTKILPHAQRRTFPGQTHGVADEVLVPVLVDFFKNDR